MALSLDDLQGVSETLLIPLFCRVWESRSCRQGFSDLAAEALAEKLEPLLAASGKRFHRDILKQRWPAPLQAMLAQRARYFDQQTRQFLAKHGDAAQVVILACGLDTRYERLQPAPGEWFLLDLPPVMALREQLLPPAPERVRTLADSVLNADWLRALDPARPTLVQAEGLLMYLPRQQIRYLFQQLATYFEQAEILVEVVHHLLAQQLSEGLLKGAFEKIFDLPGTTFQGGLSSAREPESWHPALRLLGEWSCLDSGDRRLDPVGLLRHTPLGRLQWVVRYRLAAQP